MTNLVNYLSLVLNTVISLIVGYLARKVVLNIREQREAYEENKARRKAEDKALKSAMLAMLRDRLFSNCMSALNKGEITVTDRENVTAIHQEYKNLGGNSTGDALFERAMKLKIVKRYSDKSLSNKQ